MSREPTSEPSDHEVVERPEHGARLVVRIVTATADEAAYAVALATSDSTWEGQARVRELDGFVETQAWTPETPPSWLAQGLHALLRSAWQRRRAGHTWPRRLARWRPSPEGTEA